MANKLYEETAIQDIASAIREKNGSTDTYKVAQMGNAIRGISSGIDVSQDTVTPDTLLEGFTAHNAQGEAITGEVKHRIFKGEVTSEVKGQTAYVDLITVPIIAEHYNDPNLWVKVTFDIEPTAYTIKENWAFNNVASNSGASAGDALKREGQLVWRYGSDGSTSNNIMGAALNGQGEGTQGVGRLYIMPGGTLRIYSSSSNYAIRPSKFTVEVNWNA